MRYAVPYTDPEGLRDYREVTPARGTSPRSLTFWLVVSAFVLGFLFGAVTRAESCVSLHVRPQILAQTGTIEIQARIRRHADHRAYLLEWESDAGTAGSSGPHALAGLAGPVLLDLSLRDQPPAHYWFLGRVFDEHGRVTGVARADILSGAAGP